MKTNIPILMYHHVAPDREITPRGFEAQMRQLLDQGYQSLSMSEVVASVRGERTFDSPVFALTFDDGYLNNWVHAFPVLKKLKLKATVYAVTQYVNQERDPGRFFTWKEARAMVESGEVEIGSHTQSHRQFIRKNRYDNLESELRGSKALIEEKLGRACDHLAWPWGDYETAWLPLVRQIGYRSAVTTLAGANARGSDPFVLRRIKVSREDPSWLLSRLKWQAQALPAAAHGFFYGWDRRFKSWIQRESPYAHG